MADKVAGLLFRISADTKALRQGMTKAQRQTKQLKSSMVALGGAMAAAFSVKAIGRFFAESVKLYDVQAKAEAKLLTALKGREDSQQRLITQAQKLQEITLFGDEETIAAQSMLATMGLEEKAIRRLIPLVQDMATAKGMNLVAAADLVAKSVGSSTNALSRYGIVIKGAVGSTERLDSAVGSLTEMFKGQSEAAREAGTGGLTALKNVLGDIREELGKATIGTADFNENVSKLANDLGAIDWEKIFSGIKEGVGLFSKLNPLILAFIANWELTKKILPKKQSGVYVGEKAKLGTGKGLSQVSTRRPNLHLGSLGVPGTRTPGSYTGIPSPISGMGDAFQIDVSKMAAAAAQLKERVVPEIKEAVLDLSVVFQQTFMSAVDSFGEGIENIFAGTASMENGMNKILKSLGKFMVKIGGLFIAWGIADEAFAASLKTLFTGVGAGAAIAAGAALVAIGSAISGAASSVTSSGGGGYAGSYNNLSSSVYPRNLNVNVQGVIKGQDLYLVQQKYANGISRL